jgi:hypothetical protein
LVLSSFFSFHISRPCGEKWGNFKMLFPHISMRIYHRSSWILDQLLLVPSGGDSGRRRTTLDTRGR